MVDSAKLVADVRAQIATIADKATEAEQKAFSDLIKRAKGATYGAEMVTYTPGMSALIFIHANPHNRKWQVSKTSEYARRMSVGQWCNEHNQLPGFYVTGELEDAQHRFAAAALSGHTWKTLTVLGIKRSAISTVDAGLKRSGADHAGLDGIENGKLKETILRMASSYLVRRGDKAAAIRSEAEMSNAIKAKDSQLSLPIDIAKGSETNLVNPLLKTPVTATTAYLMIEHGWAEMRVREKLALFNSGQSDQSDKDPFFVAGEMITKSHERGDKRDKLNSVNEVGLIIIVMGMTEHSHAKAIQKASLRATLKKGLPDPTYSPASEPTYKPSALQDNHMSL